MAASSVSCRSWPGSARLTSTMLTGSPRSEERRVGKECRSRCDWSSDVCSSDLGEHGLDPLLNGSVERELQVLARLRALDLDHAHGLAEIGRASCRERV